MNSFRNIANIFWVNSRCDHALFSKCGHYSASNEGTYFISIVARKYTEIRYCDIISNQFNLTNKYE